MAEHAQGSSVRELLTVLFKRKATILVTFLTVVATVTVVSFLLPPTYEAQSRLLVKFGREYIYRPEVGGEVDGRSLFMFNNEDMLNSEVKILTSRDLIERVIGALRLETLYPKLVETPPERGTPMDAAVERFTKDLSVEGVKKSNVIEIAYQHRDPQLAARALNLLAELFKEKHLQAHTDPKSSFLEAQLAIYQQRLRDSENRLEAFKQRHAVYSLGEQRSLMLNQRTEVDAAARAARNQVRELEERIASLETQMQQVAPEVALHEDTERHKIVDDAKAQLLALQLREQQLLQKYTERNQLVVNVRREIQLVQDFIRTQQEDRRGPTRKGKNVVYQELESELIKLRAELPSQRSKAAALSAQAAQLDGGVRALDLREKELGTLRRELAVNDRNYRTYLQRVEEARISEDLDRQKSANISVIQEAAVPGRPLKPHKPLNIALGIILGGIAGTGLAFLREYASETVSTPEGAERRLGLPVLVAVGVKQ
ncbi:MAG: GumC family protein [Candidatus Methylomirabilales bacterium]